MLLELKNLLVTIAQRWAANRENSVRGRVGDSIRPLFAALTLEDRSDEFGLVYGTNLAFLLARWAELSSVVAVSEELCATGNEISQCELRQRKFDFMPSNGGHINIVPRAFAIEEFMAGLGRSGAALFSGDIGCLVESGRIGRRLRHFENAREFLSVRDLGSFTECDRLVFYLLLGDPELDARGYLTDLQGVTNIVWLINRTAAAANLFHQEVVRTRTSAFSISAALSRLGIGCEHRLAGRLAPVSRQVLELLTPYFSVRKVWSEANVVGYPERGVLILLSAIRSFMRLYNRPEMRNLNQPTAAQEILAETAPFLGYLLEATKRVIPQAVPVEFIRGLKA